VRHSSNRDSKRGLIGSGQSPPYRFDERPISLKAELTSLRFEGRLMRDESQLVLHKRAKRLGNEVELPAKLLVRSAEAVEPDAKPFIELVGAAALKPCTKSVGEDRGLR